MEILSHQYNLIREGRENFLNYCATLQRAHLVEDLDDFGGRSIRYLLVHINNTYSFWLGHYAGLKPPALVEAGNYTDINSIAKLFGSTDRLVFDFLAQFADRFEIPMLNKVPKRDFGIEVTPLQLFTHVISHEYHHKGQVLSMSRRLGYIPIDTDLIRF